MSTIILQTAMAMLGGILAADANDPAPRRFEYSQPQMGTVFKIILYAEDADAANGAAAAAFARIGRLNRLLSDYDAASELSRLSAQTERGPMVAPAPVSDDLWTVLASAQAMSRRTDGAFDVSVGPLTRLWRQARRAGRLPDPEKLAAARSAVGFNAIELDESARTVRLTKTGMRLDLGGIAKGYASDAALAVLKEKGFPCALVDGGGGMSIGAPPPGDAGWKVALAGLDPKETPIAFLQLANCGVATSGDARQYVEINGVRYSHILDPRTGVGLTQRRSASVIAPTGMQADALATAVCVLGAERGLAVIDSSPETAAALVELAADEPAVSFSKSFPMLPRAEAGAERREKTR